MTVLNNIGSSLIQEIISRREKVNETNEFN
jgi:hypothetical protein